MLGLKKRILLSFTVFAMFFGAGNLIFPPYLAYEAGRSVIPAFIGFIATAIGLPVLSLIAIGKAGATEKLASRVHPVFAAAFTIAIYLAIGPCLAIPRTASTSYEMVANALPVKIDWLLIPYSIIFFVLSGIIALRPEKLTKRLGRILSPLLVTLIAVLFIGSMLHFSGSGAEAAGDYATHPFSTGFTDGYQTMDALAGLVFGIVLALNIEALGVKGKDITKESAIASIGGGVLLLAVYSMIVVIGLSAKGYTADAANGADVLSAAAAAVSGHYGRAVLALIFVIACFNTSVSLLSSCGEYFHHLQPRIPRGGWIAIFAAVSCLISNVGLNAIISISSPILTLFYPAAIMLIALSFLPHPDALAWTHRIGVVAALIASLLNVLGLYASTFLWIVPAVIGSAIGYVIDRKAR